MTGTAVRPPEHCFNPSRRANRRQSSNWLNGKLPGERELAKRFNVNAKTLSKALTDLAELEYCDLVLESVVEDLGTKKQLFSELDAACSAGTLLATNTSTLPILELAVSVSRADRVLGMQRPGA